MTLPLPPEALVDLALARLDSMKIVPVEWRVVLYRRMSVPILPKHYSYIIPDSSINAASMALNELGLPNSKPDEILSMADGADFYDKAYLHRITKSTDPGVARYIALFPSSFTQFTDDELQLDTSETHEIWTNIPIPPARVLVPLPHAVYACLLRLLCRYPKSSPTRSSLLTELAMLMEHHLYHPYDNSDSDSDLSDYEDTAIIAGAVAQIRSWAPLWRKGEEWMGKALVDLVVGRKEFQSLPALGADKALKAP